MDLLSIADFVWVQVIVHLIFRHFSNLAEIHLAIAVSHVKYSPCRLYEEPSYLHISAYRYLSLAEKLFEIRV